MDKKAIFEQLISALTSQLKTAIGAANQAHESATDRENIAENKYDTLGLEASYLAAGQAERVEQCKKALAIAQKLSQDTTTSHHSIQIGSLVCLCDMPNQRSIYLIMPVAGGTILEAEGEKITVLTPQSPLGQQLIGRELNDDIVLTINATSHYLDIQKIY